MMKETDFGAGTEKTFVNGNGTSFPVYCDPDGWTVIQSRGQFGNPQEYFLRNWDEYERGFGEPGNELPAI